MWVIWLRIGDCFNTSGDINSGYSPIDYFMFSFPIETTNLTICLTNVRLKSKGKKRLDKREFCKFLVAMILITRFNITTKENVWSFMSINKYILAVKLRQMTGMS